MIKKIAVIGRARVGKSRICSRFCKKSNLIVEKFTSAGKDCTPVNFRYILKKNLSEENNLVKFISPNSSLNGMELSFDEEGIKKFIDKINNENFYSKTSELSGKKKKFDIKNDFIEIISQASDLAIEIMEDEDELIVTDTPGVSGNVEGLQNVSDADVYIFVMRPENAQEYANSIKKMLPVIAGSRVIFVYRMDEAVTDEEEYKDIIYGAQKAMKEFESDLSSLKDSIINTSIEVLNPSNFVIPMGAFSKNKINYAENKFNENLINNLKKVFNSNSYDVEEIAIKKALLDENYDRMALVDFIKRITDTYVININDTVQGSYLKDFLDEHHDRVKFNDGSITLDIVNANRTEILNKLYEEFKKLKVNNENTNKVPKILQEQIIKYVYKKISKSIKSDCGMSKGNHPFEYNPPITMWAEEAIIAEDLVQANATSKASTYCDVMKKKGFTSKSWNFVTVEESPYSGEYDYCNKKLDIILKCNLNKLPSNNRKQLIYNSYNLALLKLGQYSVYKYIIQTLNLSVDPIDWV